MTSEEFIVIFDSDFLPRPDFLDRAAAYITADPNIGVVQFKWSDTNRAYNWITKSVSIGMDAHFLIEQPARSSGGLFLNFNGSGGIIRVSALRESGGWQSDTLAEDLDASCRMQLNHHRIQFVLDDVPCEVTPTVASFKRQQGRWARGSLQVAKKNLGRLILARDVSLRQKFAGSIHLTYYLVAPLMYFSFLLAATAAIFNIDTIRVVLPSPKQVASIGADWFQRINVHMGRTTLGDFRRFHRALYDRGVGILHSRNEKAANEEYLRNAPSLLTLGILGYGISISNTVEAMKAFIFKDSGSFKRTPKYAIMESDGTWRDKKYQVPVDFASIVEAFSVCICRVCHNHGYTLSQLWLDSHIEYLLRSVSCLCSWPRLFQSGKEKGAVESMADVRASGGSFGCKVSLT